MKTVFTNTLLVERTKDIKVISLALRLLSSKMLKTFKNVVAKNLSVEKTKDIKVISLPLCSLSLVRPHFPSTNQRQEQQTFYCTSYLKNGTKDCGKLLKCNSFENAGRRQLYSNTSDYCNLYTATATKFPERHLQKKFCLPILFSKSFENVKDNVSPDRKQEDLSKDLLSHDEQQTSGEVLHRIPTGPSPSPPRVPTYPPTCPPSLAPPYPVPTPCPYNRPRPALPPEIARERCDVPVCPPCTVYPCPPPAVSSPSCNPLTNPLRDVRLPKRNSKPRAQKVKASSFQINLYRKAHKCACLNLYYSPQLQFIVNLIRFIR